MPCRRVIESLFRLAGVAQLVEQLIRNQQVVRSIRIAGSKFPNECTDFAESLFRFSRLTHYLTHRGIDSAT